jgi:glycosyltransferase involved in cell wall biosynthesis
MPTSRVFEALACGTFVISDKVPSLQERFPLLGYVDNAAELQQALRRFLSDKVEREKRTKKMYEKFLNIWTWDRLVNDLLKFIERSK